MNRLKKIQLLTALMLLAIGIYGQPFTLDNKLKPSKLQLENDREWKGAKYAGIKATIAKEGDYYFVKGHSMFQPVDIFLAAENGETLKMEIVKNNWNDIKKTNSTAEQGDGIANAKVRTYGDFGIHVTSEKGDVPYYLIVYASPEIKNALPSPFVAMDKKGNSKNGDKAISADDKNSISNNLLLIAGGVIILLLIIILATMLRKKKGAKMIFLLVSSSMLITPVESYAQAGRRHSLLDLSDIHATRKDAEEQLKKIADKLKELKEKGEKIEGALEAYLGLGDCFDSGAHAGMPSVPSFCTNFSDGEYSSSSIDESHNAEQACNDCFINARTSFEKVRRDLEQLRIIYKCTKNFSDKAIAFGDNASGVHAVTGLTWQAERGKIEQSVKDLQSAYDKKYAELLVKLQESMMELAACEEIFGTPDWYDRFGYMFFEFAKDKYKRAGD